MTETLTYHAPTELTLESLAGDLHQAVDAFTEGRSDLATLQRHVQTFGQTIEAQRRDSDWLTKVQAKLDELQAAG